MDVLDWRMSTFPNDQFSDHPTGTSLVTRVTTPHDG